MEQKQPQQPQQPRQKQRCEKCNKKLIIEYKCKCEKQFCISHLNAEEHSCTFNYKQQYQEIIKKQIDDIGPLSTKVDKI